MTGLRTAIGFLTVLPMGRAAWEPAQAVPWFPVIGLILASLVGAATVGAHTAFPPLLAAALAVTAWAVLTGGLHLDGLADTADAAFAPVDQERRLAILSDVYHGTFAMVAVVLVIAIKVSALASLGGAEAAACVVLAIVATRGVLALVIRVFPAAKAAGMGSAARAGATPVAVVAGLGFTAAAGAVVLGWMGVAVAGGLVLAALGAGWWLSIRFDGLTGDCYGAIVEVVETLAVTTAAGLLANGHASAFPLGGRL